MPTQRPWSEGEAVVLLEALIGVLNGKETRKDAVKRVSKLLRENAVNSGIIIDEVYRNENGISFQMHSMESAYRGYTVMKPASLLFTRIVLLRKTDVAAYNKLLKEAMGIMDNKKIFCQWLSEKPSKKYPADTLISALDEAAEYCKSHSLSKKSFWDMTEAREFTAVATKLLGMRLYRLKYKNTATVLDKAVPMYKEFLSQRTTAPIEEAVDEDLELVYVKDDSDETIEKKLKRITLLLQTRYKESPAKSLTEVINNNKDLPVAYINMWAKKARGQTAAPYLIEKGIIQIPLAEQKSEEEKKQDRINKLEEWTQLLISRYITAPIDSLTELISQNNDISFTALNGYSREFYGQTASEYLRAKGVLCRVEEKTTQQKLETALAQIRAKSDGKPFHSISEISRCGIDITTVTLGNWVKKLYGKSLSEYLAAEGIILSESAPDIIVHNEPLDTKDEDPQRGDDETITIDDMELSLFRSLEYLKTRYDVRLSYNHLADPDADRNDILHKVRNDKKDVMWVYYVYSKSAHYISIETEPEYIASLNGSFPGFTRVQLRSSHPCQKLFFEDYGKIKQTLISICDSIDRYFNELAFSQKEEFRNKIYQKLYSLSKVYDDPAGVSLARIVAMLGNNVEEQLVADILESAPWATRLSEKVYSFSRKPNPSATIVDTKSAEASRIITDADFFQYLHLQLGLADATCRSYVSAIRTAESYAANIGVTGKIYGCSVTESLSLMQTLLNDANFREFNIKQHNRFTAAFTKLSEMIGLSPAHVAQPHATAEVQRQEVLDDYDADKFKETLLRRYGNGMQFDSIDFDNFREMYEMLYDEKLAFSDAELEKRLRDCGVVYQDRLFPSEGIIDSQTRVRLFEYIEKSFASGNSVLYYKAIFSDLSDAFAYCFSLTDEMMLKAYIEFEAEKGKYYFFSDYMSTEKDVRVDHTTEITEYLLSAGKPLSFDEIYSGLSHVSSDLIYREIQTNPDFLRNEKSHYFHIGIFELSQEEADQISSYISEEIAEDGYAIWSRIFIRIQDNMPVFLENNLYLSSLGIRNALARKLDDRFNFDSEVICNSNQHLSMGDVYTLFARHHAPFSDVDLYNFSKEIGTVIYFWSVAEEAVRVSKELFVPKKQIEFDIVATDKALGTYLSDGYILAKDVDSFLVFPNVGYEWNAFLLESYLMHYSKKYTLVNNGTSLNNVAGAVVKQGGAYSEFVDICADVLANSDIELKKDSALDYLAMQNLITRRSYRDIDVAITKARQIRNRKG